MTGGRMARLDPHSYADSEQPQTERIELELRVDFGTSVLKGEIVLHFAIPAHLRTVMAGAALGRTGAADGEVTDSFAMPQPIPPYLIAFAVGDLSPRQLSVRSAVWAERKLADAAAAEFEQIEYMTLA